MSPLEATLNNFDSCVCVFSFHKNHAIFLHGDAQSVLGHPNDHLGSALVMLELLGDQATLALHRPLGIQGATVVFGTHDGDDPRIVFTCKD